MHALTFINDSVYEMKTFKVIHIASILLKESNKILKIRILKSRNLANHEEKIQSFGKYTFRNH